jgi:hypothetical protein
MSNEQSRRNPRPLDQAITARLAAIGASLASAEKALAPFRARKALAGVKTIEIALGSLRRRIEAGEDVTDQIRAIALLVTKLEETLSGGEK